MEWISRLYLGRLSGYSIDVRTVVLEDKESIFGLFFLMLVGCILKSHGYRGKVYPTYCDCFVFTARVVGQVKSLGHGTVTNRGANLDSTWQMCCLREHFTSCHAIPCR